jgi:hypothetical protein
MVVLLGTNLENFNLVSLRAIAHQALGKDLTVTSKSQNDVYASLLKLSDVPSIKRQITFTFAFPVHEYETLSFMEMFHGMGLTIHESKQRCDLFIVTGTLEQWYNVITTYNLDSVSPTTFRSKILSQIQDVIETSYNVHVFTDFYKESVELGTYCLVRN